MRAITIENGDLQFREDHAEPVLKADEVPIAVKQAGICETDLQLVRGYMDFCGVLGHEFVGIAESGEFQGQRVVGEINCNCRQCPRCQTGLGNHCANRTVIGIDRHDGVFAERVAVPADKLHPIPDSVTDDEAVFVEPLAAAFQIPQQVPLANTDRVAILGDGRLAMLSAQVLRVSAAELLVIGKHDLKLNRFATLGMTAIKLADLAAKPFSNDAQQSQRSGPASAQNRPSVEKSFDVVVDCTGSETGLPLALSLVRPRGTVVMKTTVASPHQLSLAPIVIDEVTVVGSRCGPFAKAIRALEDRSVDVSDLITHRYPLESVHEAMQTAVSPEAFKVVFDV